VQLTVTRSLGIPYSPQRDMSFTLFRSLTELQNPVFPATESIKQLIETIGRDVVQFRRNTQISYHFVDRARSACDIINALIQKVDEEDDWESYDKFTEASDLLEECATSVPYLHLVSWALMFHRLLVASTATTQDEAHRYLCEDKDIDRCIESMTAWETNRRILRESLYSLRTKPEIAVWLTPCSSSKSNNSRLGAAAYGR
jgi:hypothetical protein